MPRPVRPPAARRWLIAWTLVAAALRAYDLAGQSLWSDEDITLDRARTALGALLAGLPGEQAPLYFVVVRAWTRLAGESDLALRFPSLLAGVAGVPLAFAVARRLTDRPTALAAGALAATSPFLVSYGQEARMYALLFALGLAALAAALAADDAGRPACGRWLACGALTAATVYTHYYGLLVAAVLAAWGAPAVRSGGRRGRGWLLAGATAAALFAPWLPRALAVAEHPGWREPVPPWRVPDLVAVAWSAQTGVTAGRTPDAAAVAATALAVALLAIGVGGWIVAARGGAPSSRRRGARRALAWLVAMTAVAAAVVLRTPDVHPRYLVPLLGAWQLGVAAGGRALARRFGPAGWLPLAALVALAVPPLWAHYRDPAARKTDYRRLATTVLSAAPAASSRLFLDGPSLGLTERYVPLAAERVHIVFDGLERRLPSDADLKVENLRSDKNTALRAADPVSFTARLDDLARRRPNLWLASDGAAEHGADDWLAEHAYPVASTALGDVTLDRWLVPPAGDPTPIGAALPPDGFAGAEASPLQLQPLGAAGVASVRAGEVWAIGLQWLPLDNRVSPSDTATTTSPPPWPASAPAARPHRVSVRLVDATGAVAASADRAPAAGRRPTTSWRAGEAVLDRHGLLVPAATPPGRYRLAVVLYDAATLAPAFTWSHLADVTVEAAR